jgi:hypothetical protein
MLSETQILLTPVERHHMLNQQDCARLFKGCVQCWIGKFRERFVTVRYSWYKTTCSDNSIGFNDYEALCRDIEDFSCPHMDKWIKTKLVGWAMNDEIRLREKFIEMGCLDYYLMDVEHERSRDLADIQPHNHHLFADGGRLKIAFEFVLEESSLKPRFSYLQAFSLFVQKQTS